ncbi:cytochrome C oxidase subunit I [Steroidobacter denitrificans]|uniref:Cytochrome C oxidase subunit I n=1 Tax=Steroidobacter denitrificans TaxID=465721 RepID=A0A127FBE8_STEDE|nr:cbb3-type cytochrome c oxidase subunit I [Steroidobacter denitrificans]AMN47736.1 cytochrome C oxidase subunit I [Steroidobacter denitrificans]
MNTTAGTSIDLAMHDVRPNAASFDDYLLVIPEGAQRTLARSWLWLGLLALIGAGLFSVLLVLSRTPVINEWFPVVDFFRVALVVHVDLSVLVWFVALAGLLWSINGSERGLAWAWFALALCTAGAVLMSLAPFFGRGEAIMANYIPVLDDGWFITGLVVFAAGGAMLVLRSLFTAPKLGVTFDGGGALRFGLNASVVSTAVALLAFGWSYLTMPAGLDGKPYYEILFWGGGHALQFTWTLLMLAGWLWLASASGARVPLSPRVTLLMFALALVSVFITPYAYLSHDIASVEHRDLHTWAMRFGGGVAILPVSLAVVIALAADAASRRKTRPAASAAQAPLRAALVSSVLLFAAGGVIGMFISGNNVRIPAHYHGSIVGVTLALMGLVYHLLPQLGYRTVSGRLAVLQPLIYGAGQLMHIIGLVWSGGYGVQRKVAGAEQVLRSTGEVVGMGLMGLGGLIAIIGGLLFIVVVAGSMRRRNVRQMEQAS